MNNLDPRVSVHYLLDGNSKIQYVIPVYQRNYVWNKTKQIEIFLNDLKHVLETGNPHFIGMIVDYQIPGSTSTGMQYYLIDGQQRLTTIFLLYFALRERAQAERNEEMVGQLTDCLFNRYGGPERRNKLKPLTIDNSVFDAIMKGNVESLDEEQKKNNVYVAFQMIRDYVNRELSGYSIQQIIDEGLSKMELIEFSLSKGDDAQQIFESINARGKELSPVDLIRNFVLMNIPEERKDDFYQDNWLAIEKEFKDESAFLAFFRQFLINRTLTFVKKDGVYDAFKTWFSSIKTGSDMEGAFDEIKEFVAGYRILLQTKLESITNKGLRESLRDFRNIQSEMPRYLLIEMAVRYLRKEIDVDEFSGIIQIMNSYIERRAILGWDTSGISRSLTALPKYIREDVDQQGVSYLEATRFNVINRNANTAARMPTDSEVTEQIWSLNVYDLPGALHVFLDRLENHDNGIPVDTMSLSIEHLLPQDGTKWAPFLNISEDEYAKQRNRLGNLTLATIHDNSVMSNNLFDFKKEVLKGTAHLRMNVEIYNEPAWDVKHIDDRTRELTSKLLSLYPYTPSERAFVSERRRVAKAEAYDEERISEWMRGKNTVYVALSKSFLSKLNASNPGFLYSFSPNYIGITAPGTKQYCGEMHLELGGIRMYMKASEELSTLTLNNGYFPTEFGYSLNFWALAKKEADFDELLRLLQASGEVVKAGKGKKQDSEAWCPLDKERLARMVLNYVDAHAPDGLKLTTCSGSTYIRFTSKGSRHAGGSGGTGKWIKSGEILAYEVTILPSDRRINLRLLIGPGNSEIRKSLFEYAKKNAPLKPSHVNRLANYWEAIWHVDLLTKDNKTDDLETNLAIGFATFKKAMEGEFHQVEDVLLAYQTLN